MSSAISKSKPSPSPAPSASPPASAPQKYMRRAELEAQRHEAYLAEQEAAARAREERATQKRKWDEEEAARALEREEKRRRLADESRLRREQEEAEEEGRRRKRLGLPPLPPPGEAKEGDGDALGAEDIPEPELREKLRGLKEPAVLFGESHTARVRRFRQLTAPKIVMSKGPVPTTIDLFQRMDEMLVPAKPPSKGTPERTLLFRQFASYFTLVLVEWARALDARPDEVKQTTQGKQALGSLQAAREDLKPLFRKFESEDMEDGVLGPVVEIVKAAQERRYVDANDAYLRLSIGKAFVLP